MPHKITPDTVIIGCDVGKTFHQLHYMDPDFGVLGRRKIGNDRVQIVAAFEHTKTLGEPVLVVDQTSSFAALLRVVAAEHAIPVLYVTGLQARRASDLTPGRAKTDRIDAQVIAEFGRTHAHRFPTIQLPTELEAQLRLLVGHDEDLRCDLNRTTNRIRNLLTQYSPALEQALGRRVGVLGSWRFWFVGETLNNSHAPVWERSIGRSPPIIRDLLTAPRNSCETLRRHRWVSLVSPPVVSLSPASLAMLWS